MSSLRPYIWTIRISCAFVLLLAIAILGGAIFLLVQDLAAQSACQSISESIGLNDGCQ